VKTEELPVHTRGVVEPYEDQFVKTVRKESAPRHFFSENLGGRVLLSVKKISSAFVLFDAPKVRINATERELGREERGGISLPNDCGGSQKIWAGAGNLMPGVTQLPTLTQTGTVGGKPG